MLRTSDTETEILLGNKQLLGIFFAVVILLGLAFYGGYMLGRHTPAKTVAPAMTPDTATSAPSGESSSGGQTHTLPADSSASGSDSSAGSDVIKSNPRSHE